MQRIKTANIRRLHSLNKKLEKVKTCSSTRIGEVEVDQLQLLISSLGDHNDDETCS